MASTSLLAPQRFETDTPPDLRVASAHLAFGTGVALFKSGPTLLLRNYSLDGKPIQVALYAGGRIEQRDTASQIAAISNLTIKITVNGMRFEIDQHAVLSTPSDLMYALDGNADQVQVLQVLSQKLQDVDTIAVVRRCSRGGRLRYWRLHVAVMSLDCPAT